MTVINGDAAVICAWGWGVVYIPSTFVNEFSENKTTKNRMNGIRIKNHARGSAPAIQIRLRTQVQKNTYMSLIMKMSMVLVTWQVCSPKQNTVVLPKFWKAKTVIAAREMTK